MLTKNESLSIVMPRKCVAVILHLFLLIIDYAGMLDFTIPLI